MLAKDNNGSSKSNSGGSRLAYTKLVRKYSSKCTSNVKVQGKKRKCNIAKSQRITAYLRQRPNYCLPLLKRSFDREKLPRPTQNLVLHSWKEGTRKTYNNYIQQWIMFCSHHEVDPHEPSVVYVTSFLRLLLEGGHIVQ